MKTANFCVVALDETADWNQDLEIWQYADKIFSVYLFDRNSTTNCCELTPSYELRFLYYSVQWKNSFDLNEDKREELLSVVDEAEGEAELVIYVHCNQIESLANTKFSDTGTPRLIPVNESPWTTDEEYNELVEDWWQEVKCNCVI